MDREPPAVTGRPIRVALYQPNMVPGGAQHVTLTLLRHLRRDAFEPHLIVRMRHGEWLDLVPSDVPVHLLDSRVRLAWYRFARVLREQSPDVVLSMSSTGNLTACLGHWFSRTRAPLIVSERNNFSQAWSSSKRKFLAMKLAKRLWYRRASAVVTVSRGVSEDLARSTGIPSTKMITIQNPIVDEDLMKKAMERPPHPWLEDEVPLILAVGRLVDQKDFPMLIHAFGRVRSSRVARLLILGDGPDRDNLQALVSSLALEGDVQFPGFVDNPAVYMARCTVFALSSKYEGLPGVLIQAMACGAATVSTDCPSGPSEIVTNGEDGFLVPVGDAESMAAVIGRLLDDEILRGRIRSKGKLRASQFAVGNAVAKYEELLFDSVRQLRDGIKEDAIQGSGRYSESARSVGIGEAAK